MAMNKDLRSILGTHDMAICLGRGCDSSFETMINAFAGGELLRRDVVDKVIFTGGKTKGQSYPSEAEEMYDFILDNSRYKEFEGRISLEEKSIDTAGNVKGVREVLEPGKDDLLLVSYGYHLPRANRTFAAYGVDSISSPSEKILLKGGDESVAQNIIKYQKSGKFLYEFFKEKLILNLIGTVDPKGKFLNYITSRTRG
jgi:DUF218 domain